MHRIVRSRAFRLLLLGLISAISASNADAAVLYDNFGPGTSFDPSAGQGIGSNSDAEYGLLFTPSANGYIGRLTVAASSYSGAGEIAFTLYDNVLGAPGNVLETFSLSGLPSFGTSFTPQTIDASGTTYINASQSYWLIASQPNYPDVSVWHNSTVATNTQIAFRDTQYTSWWVLQHEYQWALRVDTGEAPLPGTIVLFVSGLIGFLSLEKCKKRTSNR
jgi:hypothetical protein